MGTIMDGFVGTVSYFNKNPNNPNNKNPNPPIINNQSNTSVTHPVGELAFFTLKMNHFSVDCFFNIYSTLPFLYFSILYLRISRSFFMFTGRETCQTSFRDHLS